MNVMILMKDSEVGGVASFVESLTIGLKRLKRYEAVIVGSNGTGLERLAEKFNVETINFKADSVCAIVGNYKKMCKIIRKYNINLLHAQDCVTAFYAMIYCFFHKKVKYIWSNHAASVSKGPGVKLMARYAEYSIAESAVGKQMLIDELQVSEDRIRIINLGMDLSEFCKTDISEQRYLKQRIGIEEGEKVIFLYGRLVPSKGHMFLLEALGMIAREYKDFKLIFPGENEEFKGQILDKAYELGIEDRIIFPGIINGKEYLSISDLMVLPSAAEGFGIVNVEAFCLDVPVIRTTTGGYEDMKDLCFGVNYGDVEAFEGLLRSFFAGSIDFNNMAEKASANVHRFGLGEMIENYYALYTSV